MSILGFLIETLFFTNLWIFFYNNLLKFLNVRFPTTITEPFIRRGAAPEPFEIPLYFVIAFITVIIIYFVHICLPKKEVLSKKKPLFLIIKLLVLIFLVWLFFINLGVYPLKGDIYPYPLRTNSAVYNLYFFAYIAVVLFIIIQSIILNKIVNFNKKVVFFLFSSFIIVIIALFIFEPGFPISAHDYSYFYGPIQQISQGKTIYTDSPSQYGFLSVLVISFLNKIGLIKFSYLPAFIWFLYVAQYFLCFYIIFKLSRSLFLAFIGLFSIITFNYFSIYHLPISFPQIGPMRWLPAILAIFLLLTQKQINKKNFIFFLAILVFWAIDSGISLILTYFFSLFIFFIKGSLSFIKILKSALFFIFSLAVIFFLLNLLHLLFGYQPINFFSIFSVIQAYAQAGFGMLPMGPQTYFWWIILIYLASIVYFFKKKKVDDFDSVLIFTANLSFFFSTYFIGRSHPHNLFHISLFPLLNLFLLIGVNLKDNQSSKIKSTILAALFILLIFIPAYNRKEVLSELIIEKAKRMSHQPIFQPEMDRLLKQKYSPEILMIKKYLAERKILVLSNDDTYLLYLTQKGNLFDDNPQVLILSQKELDLYVNRLLKKGCPDKLVIDCYFLKKCPEYEKFNLGGFSPGPLILEQLETKCHSKYQPLECTDKLCIVKR